MIITFILEKNIKFSTKKSKHNGFYHLWFCEFHTSQITHHKNHTKSHISQITNHTKSHINYKFTKSHINHLICKTESWLNFARAFLWHEKGVEFSVNSNKHTHNVFFWTGYLNSIENLHWSSFAQQAGSGYQVRSGKFQI